MDLYNAVNGTTYTDIDDLEINTLENVVYMSYKNDISFLVSHKKAINCAIDECIKNGILKDILEKNRSEVAGMVLTTFNKELYEKNLKADAYEEGLEKGEISGAHKQLLSQIQRKLTKGKSIEEIADALEESTETIQELINELKTS